MAEKQHEKKYIISMIIVIVITITTATGEHQVVKNRQLSYLFIKS